MMEKNEVLDASKFAILFGRRSIPVCQYAILKPDIAMRYVEAEMISAFDRPVRQQTGE